MPATHLLPMPAPTFPRSPDTPSGPPSGTVLLLITAALLAPPIPAAAQDVLERSPNLSGGWIGLPWTIHMDLPHRFRTGGSETGDGFRRTTTFTGVLGLPHRSAAALSWVSSSVTVPGEPDELEALFRHRLLSAASAPVDLTVTAGWNLAAGSVDLEAGVARWIGPLRLLGAARWFSAARGTDDTRLALAGGAAWHPLAERAPIALAADIAAPIDLADGEDPAWSAGVQVGIPYTALTFSLQASNAAATTLQGATLASGGTRVGFELTVPIPAGYFFGGYPDRQAAVEAVAEEPGAEATVVVDIRRYAYAPARLVVDAGSVVEWVNRDAVVHTATAEDGAWDSGGIPPGQAWRARFDRPGTYPYYCGPHPFMKGVVIVR